MCMFSSGPSFGMLTVSALMLFLCCPPQPVYRDLLPLYFPRSQQEEEFAAKALPEDVGECNQTSLICTRLFCMKLCIE